MTEIWRDIKNFEGKYQVSNKGFIKSFVRKQTRILKSRKNKKGYCRVSLGKCNDRLIHRLVAETFIPNPLNFKEVNHIDENPSNNTVENLEWCSHKYNLNYGTCQERARIKQAMTHPQTDRLKFNKQVLCIETGIVFKSIKESARKLKLSSICISKVCRGIRKTTGGYHFEFINNEETH